MGVDDRLLPLVHGGEGDAGRAAGGVDTPSEISLAIPLEFAGAAEGQAVGWVGRDGVADGQGGGRGSGNCCGREGGGDGCLHGLGRLIAGGDSSVYRAGSIAARGSWSSGVSVEVCAASVATFGGGVRDVDIAIAEGVLGLVAVVEHPAADAAHHNHHDD